MALQQGGFALPSPTRVVLRLIAILAGLWVLFAILVNSVQAPWAVEAYKLLALEPAEAVFGLKLWQIGSYAWLHDLAGLSHVLFNCLGLYFLGTTLERRWGGKTFLKFFLLTGLIAGLISVLFGLILPSTFGGPIVGASGALFGIIAAYSILFPDAQILLMFVIPVRSRYLIWIALGIDLILFFALPQNNTAIQTHFGGALGGWLLITGNWHPRIFWPKLTSLVAGRKKKPGLRVIDGGRGGRGGRGAGPGGGRGGRSGGDSYLN